MKILTEAQLLEQTLNTGGTKELFNNIDGFNRIEKLQHSSYQSIDKEVDLSRGILLKITNAICSKQINFEVNHSDFNFLASKFYLSGRHQVICPQVKDVAENYAEIEGHSYLFYLPDIIEIEQYLPGDAIELITIYTNISFISDFCRNFETVPSKLKSLIEQNKSDIFHLPMGKITPAMQTVLKQIVSTPYQGMLQRMYLESKTLELLVLQLAQLLETEPERTTITNLKTSEIDKIYQAKEILINNVAEPPTLIDLAQQVELHHMKLKQGFRELFDTTPFAYLRDYRMEMARNLLLESKLNILSVASAVGYANASHFAAAFKQKFGITPKACRLGNLSL